MTYRELIEYQIFRDFLRTLTAVTIFNLKGSDNIESIKNEKTE